MSGAAAGTTTSAPFRGICVAGGLTTIGDVTPNTIGSLSATGSYYLYIRLLQLQVILWVCSILVASQLDSRIIIILVVSLYANSSTGASNLYRIQGKYRAVAITTTFSGNTIGGTVANSLQSTSAAAATQVVGFFLSTSIGVFTNNTIRNLTAAGGTGTTTGHLL